MKIDVFSELFKVENLNPWKDTPLEDFYLLSPKAKGVKGEEIVSAILKQQNYEICPRTNNGHDIILNNVKTEIKFSLASKRNCDWQFTFNHIGFEKDWDQILFVGVNGDCELKMSLYSKKDVPLHLLSKQQGGKEGQNDDYMCVGLNSKKILFGGLQII